MKSTFIIDHGFSTTKYALLGKQGGQGSSAAIVKERPFPAQSAVPLLRSELSWAHALSQVCEGETVVTADVTFLLLLDALAHKRTKERLLHLCFEKLGAKQVCLGYAPCCALFAGGETSGITVDVGYSSVRLASVHQNLPYTDLCSTSVSTGCRHVEDELAAACGDVVFPAGALSSMRAQLSALGDSPVMPSTDEVTLPDGSICRVPLTREQVQRAGMKLLYSSTCSVPNALSHLARKTALRSTEAATKWLCFGGGADTTGARGVLANALLHSMLMSPPRELHVRNATHAPVDGGIILSQLSSFKDMCIDITDYMEDGPERCVHLKLVDAR